MILGCTHYPLVSSAVSEILPDAVNVIDPPLIVAQSLKQQLSSNGLLSNSVDSKRRFQVSDLTENFRLGAQRFFGSDIDLEEVVLDL